MGKDTVTEELKARGVETKFALPEHVPVIGKFTQHISLVYIPDEGMSKDEAKEVMEKLSKAYQEEVLGKVSKIYADFCQEYNINVGMERTATALKGAGLADFYDFMLAHALDEFS